MEKDLNNIDKLTLVVTIVKRGSGYNIVKLNRESGAIFSTIMLGMGAYNTDTSGSQGSKQQEEEVVLSITHDSHLQTILNNLKTKLELHNGRKGIAFTIPVNALAGEKVLTKLVSKKLMDHTNTFMD